MYTSTEGIVFRQVKAAGGRRMILLFTKKYGKISAGSSLSEKGRNKAALALRPFTYGNYELYKGREYYNLNSGEVRRSYFRIGEDVDKYMESAFVLELTEKMMPEDLPQPKLFNLLVEFLTAMEKREKKHRTLVLAYEVKAMGILGVFPVLDCCACCGEKEQLQYFSVRDGGMVCGKCRNNSNDTLIYAPKFDIVNILKFFSKTPMSGFEKIALADSVGELLQSILREYMSYYLEIGTLNSENMFRGEF